MARKAISFSELNDKFNDHFSKAVEGQSPLACALIVSAFMENALVTLLSKFLRQGSTTDGLFKPGNPLGDLSKCTDMAYCLGLIDKGMLKNIKRWQTFEMSLPIAMN